MRPGSRSVSPAPYPRPRSPPCTTVAFRGEEYATGGEVVHGEAEAVLPGGVPGEAEGGVVLALSGTRICLCARYRLQCDVDGGVEVCAG